MAILHYIHMHMRDQSSTYFLHWWYLWNHKSWILDISFFLLSLSLTCSFFPLHNLDYSPWLANVAILWMLWKHFPNTTMRMSLPSSISLSLSPRDGWLYQSPAPLRKLGLSEDFHLHRCSSSNSQLQLHHATFLHPLPVLSEVSLLSVHWTNYCIPQYP